MTQMMPDALESRTISIPGDGRRLDVALSEAAGLTRSRVAALMADGNVTVDGKVETKSGAKAKQGQIVILTIPAPKPAVPVAQEIPLTILYQDDDLAVVLKPCGMVVHPAAGNEDGTLVNALLHHLDHLSGIGGELRPGIVHRLDKDTSGLLLVAKNDQSQLALSRQLQERQMEKHYRALVEGNLREDSGRIDQPIARSKKDRKKMAIDPEGRPSITDGTCARAERDAAGRPHSDRADAPNPRAHEVHRASGLRRPDLRVRKRRESPPPDAARVHTGIYAPTDGGKDDVHRAAAGGVCAGAAGERGGMGEITFPHGKPGTLHRAVILFPS